jgi:hypothetical protein
MLEAGFFAAVDTEQGHHRTPSPRSNRQLKHRLAGLLRQSLFGRLAAYQDVNHALEIRLLHLHSKDTADRWRWRARAPQLGATCAMNAKALVASLKPSDGADYSFRDRTPGAVPCRQTAQP